MGTDYVKARRAGMKAAQEALSEDRNPHLEVLEERLPKINALAHVPLGIYQLHVGSIAGTATQGRTSAFACNLMPLLAQDTEFAMKWETLCMDVRENGIQQAIKVLEYMGKCYLVEGNKRASVAKYLGIEYLDAELTRVMPERNGSPEVEAYYEYCDFAAKSEVGELIFTRPGGYERLCGMMRKAGQEPGREDWDNLRVLIRYFREAYAEVMKQKDYADAFLKFLSAYGFYQVCTLPKDEILEKVRLMKDEFRRRVEGDSVQLLLDREEAYTLLPAFLRPSSVRAAFLYVNTPEESGWTYWHELGRINAEARMGGKLNTEAHVVTSRSEFAALTEKLVEEKVPLIFATSPVMLNSCIAPSLEQRESRFFCCSPMPGYAHVAGYYLRFYEAKFLMGLAAGIYAKSGKIGYVADYPINGVASAINAFARGVAMVNPGAKVHLTWSSLANFHADQPFDDTEIRIISNRDINAPSHSSMRYGLYLREGNEIRNLAAPLVDWSCFYTTVADHYLKGALEEAGGSTAQSYWWGMSSEALDLLLATHFDSQAEQLIDHFRKELQNGSFSVFSGELMDQQGQKLCADGQTLTPAEILCMDRLAENVVGSFPKEEELKMEARPVVKLQGFDGEIKPDVHSIQWQGSFEA